MLNEFLSCKYWVKKVRILIKKKVTQIRASQIRASQIRISQIRATKISSSHRELHGAIFGFLFQSLTIRSLKQLSNPKRLSNLLEPPKTATFCRRIKSSGWWLRHFLEGKLPSCCKAASGCDRSKFQLPPKKVSGSQRWNLDFSKTSNCQRSHEMVSSVWAQSLLVLLLVLILVVLGWIAVIVSRDLSDSHAQ